MRKKGGKYQDYSDSNFGGRGGGGYQLVKTDPNNNSNNINIAFLKTEIIFCHVLF